MGYDIVDVLTRGDFDNDGNMNVDDIDALVMQIVSVQSGAEVDLTFDLTGDRSVEESDRDEWLTDAAAANGFSAPYLLGDASRDFRPMRRSER